MAITVTIEATPEIMAIAKTAYDIQDACNPIPVATVLVDAQKILRKYGEIYFHDDERISITNFGIQNPICCIILDKLNSMARMTQSRPEGYWAVIDLLEGKSVTWDLIDEPQF
jgi:hypothetical protein